MKVATKKVSIALFALILIAALSLAMCAIIPAQAEATDGDANENNSGIIVSGSLQTTIDKVESGATIVLSTDITEDVVIPKDKTITIDLNGHKITNVKDHTVINNGVLIIKDTGENKTGIVNNITGGKAAVYNNPGATVTIDGGKYTRTNENNYYVIDNYGTMTINKGVTMLQPSKSSSGIHNGYYNTPDEGTPIASLTINGGTFASNIITIKNDEFGELVINDGNFDGVEGYAADQSVQNWTKATINDGAFGSDVITWAYKDGDNTVRGEMDINAGEFNGAVKATLLYTNDEGKEVQEPDKGANVNIIGGTYAEKLRADFLSADSALAFNEDGKYVVIDEAGEEYAEYSVLVTSKDGEAVVYETIKSAIEKADEGANVVLLKDIEINDRVNITKELTVDFNGKTATQKSKYGFVVNVASGKVVFKNGNLVLADNVMYGFTNISPIAADNITMTVDDMNITGGKVEVVVEGKTQAGVRSVYSQNANTEVIDCDITSPSYAVFASGGEMTVKGLNATGTGRFVVQIQPFKDNNTYNPVSLNISDSVLSGKRGLNLLTHESLKDGDRYDAVIDGVTINSAGSQDHPGIFMGGRGSYNTEIEFNKVTIKNSTVKSNATFAISGNGSSHGTDLTIIDSTIISEDDEACAIYHPQYGNLTLQGKTTIQGVSGIEMRAGVLTVGEGEDNVKVIATAENSSADPNGNGSTTLGAAVVISQHATNLPTELNLAGGVYEGIYAVYEADLQDENIDGIKMTITGGMYDGKVESENITKFISGGTFTVKPSEDVLAEGFGAYKNSTGNYVAIEKEGVDQFVNDLEKLANTLLTKYVDFYSEASVAKIKALLAEGQTKIADAEGKGTDAIYAEYAGRMEAVLVEQIVDEINAVGGKVDSAEDLIEALGGKVENVEALIEALGGKVENVEALIEALGGKVENLGALIDALDGKVENVETLLEALAADMESQLNDILDKLAAQGEISDSSIAELKAEIGKLNGALSALQNVTDALAESQNAGFDALNGKLDAINERLNALDSLAEAIEALDGKVVGLESILNSLNGKTDSLTKLVEELSARMEQADDTISGQTMAILIISVVGIVAILGLLGVIAMMLKKKKA